jgi:hypothetical protein
MKKVKSLFGHISKGSGSKGSKTSKQSPPPPPVPDVPKTIAPEKSTKEPTTSTLPPEPTPSVPKVSSAVAPRQSESVEPKPPLINDLPILVLKPVPASNAENGLPLDVYDAGWSVSF